MFPTFLCAGLSTFKCLFYLKTWALEHLARRCGTEHLHRTWGYSVKSHFHIYVLQLLVFWQYLLEESKLSVFFPFSSMSWILLLQWVPMFTTITLVPFPIQKKLAFMPWEISCCFLGYFLQRFKDASFYKSSIADCPQVGWKGQRATGLSWRPRENSVRSKTEESDAVKVCAHFSFHICFLKHCHVLFACFYWTGAHRHTLQ